jgi:hypothetical protein
MPNISKNRYKKQTGIKYKCKKTNKRINYKCKTHNQQGGSYGSDLRQRLVSLCKNKKWDEYDSTTQQIMKYYWVDGKKDFFIHLNRNIRTFSHETLYCLKHALTQLQEDAIPESMLSLAYIMKQHI